MKLLTSSEVAASVGLAKRTINNHVAAGLLRPTADTAAGRLFSAADVERYKRRLVQASAHQTLGRPRVVPD